MLAYIDYRHTLRSCSPTWFRCCRWWRCCSAIHAWCHALGLASALELAAGADSALAQMLAAEARQDIWESAGAAAMAVLVHSDPDAADLGTALVLPVLLMLSRLKTAPYLVRHRGGVCWRWRWCRRHHAAGEPRDARVWPSRGRPPSSWATTSDRTRRFTPTAIRSPAAGTASTQIAIGSSGLGARGSSSDQNLLGYLPQQVSANDFIFGSGRGD